MISVQEVIQTELECVKRANTCDRQCDRCDLVLPDEDIISAYEYVLDKLGDKMAYIFK